MSKKFKEIFADKGIFTIFAENFETDFVAFFPENTAANLDGFTMFKNSEMFCNSNLTELNAPEIIKSLISVFLPSWKKINTLLNAEYNITRPISETKTKTGSVTRETSETNESTDFDKVFNSTDFVGNEKNENSNTGETVETYNLTETRNANENSNISENVLKELNLRKSQNLYNEISETILNEIILKVQ